MNHRQLLLLVVAFWSPALCLATESIGEFMLSYQQRTASPMIEHCASKVPGLGTPLREEHGRFQANFKIASSGLVESLNASAALSAPMTSEIRESFQEVSRKSLAEVQKFDPESYCPWLLESLRKSTVESLKSSMEKALARYESLASTKSQQQR